MPSPFPGMDPYLEGPAVWSDLHTSMLVAIRAALLPRLPRRYAALVGQHVWLEGSDEERRLFGAADIHLAGDGPRRPGGAVSAAVAPTVTALPAARRAGHRFLRVTDRELRRVVTVVELLSPANKSSSNDRPRYLAKRDEYLAGGVNLVEIDLLRAGERMPLGEPPPLASDYYLLVARAERFPELALWPFSVRDALPPLAVPLEGDDADLSIDLKVCLDSCYDQGGYDRLIDATRPPSPPLRPDDAAWAAELLANRGR